MNEPVDAPMSRVQSGHHQESETGPCNKTTYPKTVTRPRRQYLHDVRCGPADECSTDRPSLSNCHCFVHPNSNQPAAKAPFLLEFREILGGSDATILNCLCRAFRVWKNSTCYEAQ